MLLLVVVLTERPKSLFVAPSSGRDNEGDRIGKSRLVVPADGDDGAEAVAWEERISESKVDESR